MLKIYNGNLGRDLQWVSTTPTGSWTTNTTYAGFYRLVGDNLQYQVQITLSGRPNPPGLTVNLPSGFTIDTSKLTTDRVSIGFCNAYTLDTIFRFGIVADASTPGVVIPYYFDPASGEVNYQGDEIDYATPVRWESGNAISFQCQVPVTF